MSPQPEYQLPIAALGLHSRYVGVHHKTVDQF
jgi:hypothetical protein